MKTVLHRATERGSANHGWLASNFSFSFAHYFDPKKMGFGALRVLNDDIIKGPHGFPSHPHDNMEIITIVQEGMLAHKDSTGVEETVSPGEIQVMSAGRGIIHSEYNHFKEGSTALFQLWINTKERNITPRHDKKAFHLKENELTCVVSGKHDNNTLYMHQDANIHLGTFTKDTEQTISIPPQQGVYIFVIEGEVNIGDVVLDKRDALGVWDVNTVTIVTKESKILLITVPMKTQ